MSEPKPNDQNAGAYSGFIRSLIREFCDQELIDQVTQDTQADTEESE